MRGNIIIVTCRAFYFFLYINFSLSCNSGYFLNQIHFGGKSVIAENIRFRFHHFLHYFKSVLDGVS